jgi:hypothetical protein
MNSVDSKLQKLINFHPHQAQQEILECTEREIVICAGRRFGKSSLCGYIALRTLLLGDYQGKPAKIWIVSPTYDLSLKVFEYLVRWFLTYAPSQTKGVSSRPFPQIKTARGGLVQCKSAENPTGLLGEELDLLIIDECSRIKKDVWDTYLMATLLSRKGRTFFISTPFGKNWFYDMWIRAKENKAGFQFPTLANPANTEEELMRIKKALPEDVYKQEYEAQFLDAGANVFRFIKEAIRPNALSLPKKGHSYVMGLDLAKFHDFTAIVVVDKYDHNVVFLDRFQKLPYTLQKQRIFEVARKYNCKIIIDSLNVGAAIGDELRAEGLNVMDFKTAGTISDDWQKRGSKERMVENVAMLFEQRNLFIPPDDYLVDELESFSYDLSDTGNLKYTAPEGLHDDLVMALCLACWELKGKAKTILQLANLVMPRTIKRFQYN